MKFPLIVILISVSYFNKINMEGRTLKKVSSDRRTVENHYIKKKEFHDKLLQTDTILIRKICKEVYQVRYTEIIKDPWALNYINENAECSKSSITEKNRWIIHQFNEWSNGFHKIAHCICTIDTSKIQKSKKVMDKELGKIMHDIQDVFCLLSSKGGNSFYILSSVNASSVPEPYRANKDPKYSVSEYWEYEYRRH